MLHLRSLEPVTVRRYLLAGGVMIALPLVAITSIPEPAEGDIGSGPCSTAWELMSFSGEAYHSFGEQDGFAAQPDTTRDHSHFGAVEGALGPWHHPVCGEEGGEEPRDSLPN